MFSPRQLRIICPLDSPAYVVIIWAFANLFNKVPDYNLLAN